MIEQETYVVSCAKCAGTGVINDPNNPESVLGLPCPDCEGRAIIKLPHMSTFTPYQNCPVCDEYREVIRALMDTYIINLDENGKPRASISDIMKLIDRAVKLLKSDKE